jgi:hypothetical protein
MPVSIINHDIIDGAPAARFIAKVIEESKRNRFTKLDKFNGILYFFLSKKFSRKI